jgi:hypothetical protein
VNDKGSLDRNSLTEVVAAIARGGMPVSEGAIRATTPATVVENDRERFVELVLAEFKGLHAGNAIRFGLRPLEYAQWQEGQEINGARPDGHG